MKEKVLPALAVLIFALIFSALWLAASLPSYEAIFLTIFR